MKRSLIFILFATIILNGFSCNGQQTKSVLPQISKEGNGITELNLSGMLYGVSDIEIFDLVDDTLYLIKKDKLLQIDVKTGSAALNIEISSFLANQLKENKYAKKIVVRKNHFYITFFNELYEVSKAGEVKKIYNGTHSINEFNIGKSEIFIVSRDTIKMIDFNGKELSFMFFSFTDAGFIKSAESIYYSATPDDDIHSFYADDGMISEKIYPALSLNSELQEPFISYATEKYFIVFDYWNRSTLYFIDKVDEKNNIVKTIGLKDLSYTPSPVEIKKEEGQPNFKVVFDKSTYYVLALNKGKLKIKLFTYN